ncbi:MAG: tRNA-specific 2-thiouridylase, partial [Gammaproteobacteria bacterium]|nr:tRNA-specific 2-thiouridylase [Gammaproteobacteria bacterium]
YFLHAVSEPALARSLFPLGELTKTQVRDKALEFGLHNFRKRDSTGICFIGERPFREFLANYVDVTPGQIVTTTGQAVGSHIGLPFYTLGQRQGLGIGGVAGAADAPWYVVAKRKKDNALVVAQQRDHPLLMSDWLTAIDMHWINERPGALQAVHVATRYRQQAAPAQVSPGADGSCRIEFDQPQWAVTPGQYAVIYSGDHCLGGGIIAAQGTAGCGAAV